MRNSKNQDVCHIAFGSKVLGPPPLSGRRNNMRTSTEVGARLKSLSTHEWHRKRSVFPVRGVGGGSETMCQKQKA